MAGVGRDRVLDRRRGRRGADRRCGRSAHGIGVRAVSRGVTRGRSSRVAQRHRHAEFLRGAATPAGCFGGGADHRLRRDRVPASRPAVSLPGEPRPPFRHGHRAAQGHEGPHVPDVGSVGGRRRCQCRSTPALASRQPAAVVRVESRRGGTGPFQGRDGRRARGRDRRDARHRRCGQRARVAAGALRDPGVHPQVRSRIPRLRRRPRGARAGNVETRVRGRAPSNSRGGFPKRAAGCSSQTSRNRPRRSSTRSDRRPSRSACSRRWSRSSHSSRSVRSSRVNCSSPRPTTACSARWA